MSEQGKRLARQKQSDSAYNKLLLSLAVAVVVELISLLLRRFTYTYYQSDFGSSFAVGLQAFFGVFRIAGAVLAAAGCVWAVLSVRAKKRLLLPGICTGVVVWLWLVSLLCYSFSEAGVSAMCVLPPAGAVLAFIYFLYQREFFYNAILSGIGLVAVWVFRQIYMTHPRMVYCGFAVVWAVLAAAAAVAVMMLIPALLKAKLGVSEMVNSLMLNYVVMYFIKYLMNTYLADKTKGQIQSYEFLETSKIAPLIDNGSKLSWGFVVAIACVVLIGLFIYNTRWGYTIRMIGINQAFAKYSGMKVATVIVLSQVLGGFLAGIGGGIEMLGRYPTFSWSSLPGYGWTGITIAILAGNNPWFVPFASFFMAYLTKGCELMATYANVPSQLIDIIQGVIFLFFAAEQFLSKYRQKLVVKSAEEEIARKKALEEAKEGGHANA